MLNKILGMLNGSGAEHDADPTGQSVVFARADVVLRATPDDGAAALEPGDGVFRVEGERDGWLWVATAGVEGWVRRDGVVPLGEAGDYFAEAVQRDGEERFAVQQLNRIHRATRARTRAALEQLAAEAPPELAEVVAGLREQLAGESDCETTLQSLEHFFTGLELGGDDLEAAEKAYTEAIALEPTSEAYNNRGVVRHDRGDYAGALADFDAALALAPQDVDALCNRGRTHKFAGQFDKARADYDAALRLNRHHPPGYYNRALLHVARKDYAAALADYGRAVRIDPEYTEAFNNRAWLWATCPDAACRDGRRAVKAARRACRLSGGVETGYLDTLAAAYAEAGDFARAVKWQQRVVARREAAGETGEAADARTRLALYERGQPYCTT